MNLLGFFKTSYLFLILASRQMLIFVIFNSSNFYWNCFTYLGHRCMIYWMLKYLRSIGKCWDKEYFTKIINIIYYILLFDFLNHFLLGLWYNLMSLIILFLKTLAYEKIPTFFYIMIDQLNFNKIIINYENLFFTNYI